MTDYFIHIKCMSLVFKEKKMKKSFFKKISDKLFKKKTLYKEKEKLDGDYLFQSGNLTIMITVNNIDYDAYDSDAYDSDASSDNGNEIEKVSFYILNKSNNNVVAQYNYMGRICANIGQNEDVLYYKDMSIFIDDTIITYITIIDSLTHILIDQGHIISDYLHYNYPKKENSF